MIFSLLKAKSISCLGTSFRFCQTMVKILNVAEKNDVAKGVSQILSRGQFRTRNGKSVYNKNYEFQFNFNGRQSNMVVTSVSGHLLHLEFSMNFKSWTSCNPKDLFKAPVSKQCLSDYLPVKQNIESEVHGASTLVIWTDCDREGENIGFEIIDVCKRIKPNIEVYRAKFSEVTQRSILRAIENLERPNKRISDAVDVRIELDLRIGASFTRFQTLRFQKIFPAALSQSLVSYGSCQFPTLGFVVERYKQIKAFVVEPFWKLVVNYKTEEGEDTFNWERGRLFNRDACNVFLDICLETPLAKVIDVKSKPKSKWRPLPLDTVEMQKLVSRKLKIGAQEAMHIAERLYTKGFISYPRTETNTFPQQLDLRPLVEAQTVDQQWGAFATRVLNDGLNPRKGTKSDEAHPPIHPTKYVDTLTGNDKRLYEFIVRHFLACLSKDAEGFETTVMIEIAKEQFTTSGLMIVARNYLDVYPYDKWSDKNILMYKVNQTFFPTEIKMSEGSTSPPPLLTEADLIALMEKHGIGTDATHAEHIETVKKRQYVGVQDGKFLPGKLGMGLVEGYDALGFEMSKPKLRADLEADLKKICEGQADPKVVLEKQIDIYKTVFEKSVQQVETIDRVLGTYLEETVQEYNEPIIQSIEALKVMQCQKCGSDMTLKTKKQDNGQKLFISCTAFPNCKNAVWFPNFVKSVTVTGTNCEICHPIERKKLKFTFSAKALDPFYPDEYIGCIGGCDDIFLELLRISFSTDKPESTVTRRPDTATRTNIVQPIRANNTQPVRHNNIQPNTANNTQLVQRTQGYGNQVNNQGAAVVCNCRLDANKLTVKKEGPNKGRKFYCCPKRTDGCNFFLWANDDGDGNDNNQTHTGTNNRFLPHQTTQRQDENGNARKRRKCGHCRQEGHTKTNCPSKR